MSDSAIQPDVPAAAKPETGDQQGKQDKQATPQKSARELALDELESRHQQQMAESNGYDLAVLASEDDPADQLAAQLAEPAAVVAPPAPEPARIKVKIDGAEDTVTAEEIRNYQVGKTADKRLSEATRLLQEAEVTRQLLVQQQQLAAQQAAPAQQQSNPAAPAVDVDDMSEQFVKAMFEGDDENARSAFKQAVESIAGRQQAPAAPAPAPTLDIAQIADAVTQQVQQKLVVESALARNRQDYPELYADPDLESLALVKIQRLREQDGSDFFAALDTVSKDMATKFGWGAAAAAPGRPTEDATTTSRTAKLEQKRSIDTVASINTKTTGTEQQPENPSDVIAAMKAARAGS
jgi:hypothetical protein